MNLSEVICGCRYIHKVKKTVEEVIFVGKVKINGEWFESIVYRGIDYKTGKPCVFTRTVQDFLDNFEKYED